MMKINYTLFSTALTGGTRVILEIADRLAERGHNVTVTSLGTPLNLWWTRPKAKIRHVEKFVLPRVALEILVRQIPGMITKYLEQLILTKKIMDLTTSIPDCDINVATLCFTAFSVYRSAKGIPFYHMQHYEPLFFSDPYIYRLAEETYFLPINKIANCSWLKEKLHKKYGFENIPVVNPAIDHKVFFPHEKEKRKNKFRIVSLGKTDKWKGLNDLFQAVKIVYKERKDIELVLFERIKRWYPPHDFPLTFVQAPVNEKLAELYSSCDLLVSASWYESFPLPPLEAMACGLPVVTTQFGTEDYAFNGKNALVVPPKDPKALAEAILKLMGDKALREKLSEEGIKTAKQFTWDKTVDKIEELFKAALGNA